MLSADKVISLGSSAFLTAGYYAFNKGLMPTNKGLYSQLGGMAAASLFHAYYPDNCEQIREKIGENWDYAVQWLYPGMIFVAGYLGGVSLEINLLATAVFSYNHVVVGMISWDVADRRIVDQAEVLTKDMSKNISDNRLETAGTVIDQANALRKKLASPHYRLSWKMSQIDLSAVKLSSAYLHLSIPNVEKAEEWARKIIGPAQKFTALQVLAKHLLKGDKNEKTSQKIEGLIAECETLDRQLFSLRYDFAMKYEKPDLVSKIKEELEALGETTSDISTIMKFAYQGMIHKDNEFTKACIKLVEDRLEKFKTPDRFAFYSEIPPLDKDLEPFSRDISNRRPEDLPSIIVSFLFYLALKVGEEETALRLMDSKHLTRIEDRLVVHMDIAREKSTASIEEFRSFIAKITDLIDGYTLPADVADRDISIAKFQREAYRKVVLFQMKFDLEGAHITALKAPDGDTDKLGKGKGNLLLTLAGEAETKNPQLARRIAADLDASFDKLTYQERISLMKLQRKVDSETLVSSYGEHTAVWVKGSLVERAWALQVIGNYYFGRGLYSSAQGILTEIQAFGVDADVYDSLASKLQGVTIRFWHG